MNDVKTELAMDIAREIVTPLTVAKEETLFKSQLHRIRECVRLFIYHGLLL